MDELLINKVKMMIDEEPVKRLHFMEIIAPLKSTEKMILLSHLNLVQQKKFIETVFSLDYSAYQELIFNTRTEYAIFKINGKEYFNEKVKNHVSLTTEKEMELIEKVNESRRILLEKEDYGSLLCDAFCQHANLKNSSSTILDSLSNLDFNLEHMTLYLDFLSIHTEKFSSRNVEDIKMSIKNSIYVSREGMLLEKFLMELKNNSDDSFLIIPITQRLLSGSFHTSTIIIRKVEDKIILTSLDKAMHYRYELLPQIPKVEKRNYGKLTTRLKNFFNKSATQTEENYKVAIPLVMEVNNTPENRVRLTHYLNFGTSYFGKAIQSYQTNETKDFLIVQKEILKISDKVYWTPEIYDPQMYLDNCFIKSVSAAFQHVLGNSYVAMDYFAGKKNQVTVKKIPGFSAADITISLAEICKYRMSKIGYSRESNDYVDKILNLYLSGKETHKNRIKKREAVREIAKKISEEKIPIFTREYVPNIKIESDLFVLGKKEEVFLSQESHQVINLMIDNEEVVTLLKNNINENKYGRNIAKHMNDFRKRNTSDSEERERKKKFSRDYR